MVDETVYQMAVFSRMLEVIATCTSHFVLHPGVCAVIDVLVVLLDVTVGEYA